jgi:hypothetical protein
MTPGGSNPPVGPSRASGSPRDAEVEPLQTRSALAPRASGRCVGPSSGRAVGPCRLELNNSRLGKQRKLSRRSRVEKSRAGTTRLISETREGRGSMAWFLRLQIGVNGCAASPLMLRAYCTDDLDIGQDTRYLAPAGLRSGPSQLTTVRHLMIQGVVRIGLHQPCMKLLNCL